MRAAHPSYTHPRVYEYSCPCDVPHCRYYLVRRKYRARSTFRAACQGHEHAYLSMWKCLHDDPGTSKLLKQIYGASRPDIAYPKVRALVEFHLWYNDTTVSYTAEGDEFTPAGTSFCCCLLLLQQQKTGAQALAEPPTKPHDTICKHTVYTQTAGLVLIKVQQYPDAVFRLPLSRHLSCIRCAQ